MCSTADCVSARVKKRFAFAEPSLHVYCIERSTLFDNYADWLLDLNGVSSCQLAANSTYSKLVTKNDFPVINGKSDV